MKKFLYYIGHILFGLVVAQLMEKESLMVNLAGLVIILAQSYYIFNYLKDRFLFITYLLMLCTIYTRDNFGGVTLVPFIILIEYYVTRGRLVIKDNFVRICLYVLILANFAGYLVKNPQDVKNLVQSVVIFTGIIITFIFIQNFSFKRSHPKIIFTVVTLISIFSFLAALNQKFVFYDTNWSLLGGRANTSVSMISTLYFGRMPSLLADYELFAELSLLIFIVTFCVIMDRRTMKFFDLGNMPYILLVFSVLNMFITGTRAAILLVVLFIIAFSLIRFRAYLSKTAGKLILIGIIAIPGVLLFGKQLGVDQIIERFKLINIQNITVENIRTGEKLNREIVYRIGYKRLAEENWLIGFGFGREEGNSMAWYGTGLSAYRGHIRDFHSLYLSIPMIYGWIGSFAYIVLVLYISFILFRKYLTSQNSPLSGIVLGFAFMFLFFLMDQYKINSLRFYNYHFLIWILMGLALSVFNQKPRTIEDPVVDE